MNPESEAQKEGVKHELKVTLEKWAGTSGAQIRPLEWEGKLEETMTADGQDSVKEVASMLLHDSEMSDSEKAENLSEKLEQYAEYVMSDSLLTTETAREAAQNFANELQDDAAKLREYSEALA